MGHSKTIILAASALAVVSAAEIDRDDIPAPCQAICYPLVQLAAQCDRDNNNDRAEIDCICQSTNPNTSATLPDCDACVRQYDSDSDDDDDDDGDVADLRRECNLPRIAAFTGQTVAAPLGPLPSRTAAGSVATSPTSVSTTVTADGTTRTTVIVVGQTSGANAGTTATPTATNQDSGAEKLGAGVAAAGIFAAVAAFA